ncbi:uncharacterized protein TNCV_2073291 [Trichonephila clavipes]|uniref:Uncharacterized protein n=1 Tax=Trichonephila clavipes TaxID=2585209 RepID=A0A8X6US66_TRICX|nr:uncharacterized protein TNCV_2073291 [Trichonephila clavipes]
MIKLGLFFFHQIRKLDDQFMQDVKIRTLQDDFPKKKHQKTQQNVSPSEQEEDKRGPLPKSAIKYLLKKWVDVRAMVLEWHTYQAAISRFGYICNNNAINYTRSILKKIEKQSTLDMFFNAP